MTKKILNSLLSLLLVFSLFQNNTLIHAEDNENTDEISAEVLEIQENESIEEPSNDFEENHTSEDVFEETKSVSEDTTVLNQEVTNESEEEFVETNPISTEDETISDINEEEPVLIDETNKIYDEAELLGNSNGDTNEPEEEQTYVLTVDANGKTFDDGSTVKQITVAAEHTFEDISFSFSNTEGYFFDGWYYDQECTRLFSNSATLSANQNFPTPLTENTTIYAKWLKTITVRLNFNGGRLDLLQISWVPYPYDSYEIIKKQNSDIELEYCLPRRWFGTHWVNEYRLYHPDGYKFIGWYFDKEGTEPAPATFKAGEEDVTVYAKWDIPKIKGAEQVEIGKTSQYQVETVTENAITEVQWVSNNEEIATIDENGLLTANAIGEVTITATTNLGTFDFVVNVIDRIIYSIDVEEESIELLPGESKGLTLTINPEGNKTSVVWTSNDASVATVDENGLVSGQKPGQAIITATLTDEESAAELQEAQNAYDAAILDEQAKRTTAEEAKRLLDSKTSEVETIATQIGEKEEEIQRISNTLNEELERKNETEASLITIQNEYETLVQEKTDLTNTYNSLYNQYTREAEQRVTDAQTAYEQAQTRYEAAETVVQRGTLGFFESVGNEEAQWIINNRIANQASDTTWGHTELGAEGDATSLENMKKSIPWIYVGNRLRAEDDHNEGVNKLPLKVTDEAMAAAQVSANGSSTKVGHSRLAGTELGYGENAAWGYLDEDRDGPYDGWYHDEKLNYENPGRQGYTNGKTGHYKNLVDPDNEKLIPSTNTGFAVASTSGELDIYTNVYIQKFGDKYSGVDDVNGVEYTVEEYEARFNDYYTAVMTELETARTLLDDTKSNYEYLSANSGMTEDQNEILQGYTNQINAKTAEIDTNRNSTYPEALSELQSLEESIENMQKELEALEEKKNQLNSTYETALNEKNNASIEYNQAQVAYDEASLLRQEKEALVDELNKRLDEQKDTCVVTVLSVEPTSITTDKKTITLKEGENATVIATILPNNASDKTVNWTSSNISIASVDQQGVITAHKAGTATITVETSNGKKATCKVTVKNPITNVTSVKVSSTNATLTVGKTTTLKATVSPSNATNKKVTWTSSDTNVAKVDSNGKVTAVNGGTATITVTTQDGKKTAKATVTVNMPKVQAVAIYNSAHGADIRWKPINGVRYYGIWRKRTNPVTKVLEEKIVQIIDTNTYTAKDGGNYKWIDPYLKDKYTDKGKEWEGGWVYYVTARSTSDTSEQYNDGKHLTIDGPISNKLNLYRLRNPELKSVTSSGDGKVTVTWSNVPTAFGYEVQYTLDSGKTWTKIPEAIAAYWGPDGREVKVSNYKPSVTIDNLPKGKKVNFRIRCRKTNTNLGDTWSEYSPWKSVTKKSNSPVYY